MSKGKKLLNEDTVKRFMKLAGTEKLYEGVKLEEEELEEGEELEEAEALEEQLPPGFAGEDEDEGAEAALGDLPPEDVEGPPPEAMEPEAEVEADPAVVAAVEDIIQAVGDAAAAHGVDVDLAREGELEGEPGGPGAEMPPPPDFLPAAEEEEEEGLPPGLEEARRGAAQKELFMEELSRRVANRVKREHIVERVTKRVAQRLQGAKRRTKR